MVQPADQSTGRILALDGWRGISAVMVVVGHLVRTRYSDTISATGVLIFFAISGFIITKLAIGERAKSGHFSLGRFYVRRGLRILPPFFAYLAFVFAVSKAGLIEQTPAEVYKAGGFLCITGFIKPCEWFVTHSASLGYEELFYILFPLIFFTFGQRPRTTFGLILVGLLTFLALRKPLQLEINGVAVTVGLFTFIASGAVAAAFEPAVARLATTRLGTGLWLISAAIVVARIIYSANTAVDAGISFPFVLKLLPFATTWLVVGSLYGGSRIFAFLTWPPLIWVGRISYSLYLWQQLFTAAPQLYPVPSPLLFPPLMFVVAAASYYWIELPCMRTSKWLMARQTLRSEVVI
jgi:peptidoglycan/LPS O-acetylase OafA/YrhL